jgi:hypothetical protein
MLPFSNQSKMISRLGVEPAINSSPEVSQRFSLSPGERAGVRGSVNSTDRFGLKTITIVGGGLAGLTLGIALRQRKIPVTLWESGSYPRHRVCGEFISGDGPAVLQRLGLLKLLEDAGAIRVDSVAFISGSTHSPIRNLPAPAIGLSRYSMDAALAKEFQRLGGDLHENSRWHPPNREELKTFGKHSQQPNARIDSVNQSAPTPSVSLSSPKGGEGRGEEGRQSPW